MQPDEPSRRGADPWLGHYAQRAAGMVASEVRALFAVASRPEIVSLAGGMPNVSALPMDAVAALMADLVTERGSIALQYGSAQGDPSLRETICTVMAEEGIDAHPDDVVVTVGSQQALDLVARVFLNPGDTVVSEGPPYVTALGTFAAYQARAVHVDMDERGVLPRTGAGPVGRGLSRAARHRRGGRDYKGGPVAGRGALCRRPPARVPYGVRQDHRQGDPGTGRAEDACVGDAAEAGVPRHGRGRADGPGRGTAGS
ncbi:aminotransferase class I/II-fold pyridoxal phosphate-dependent enzyme [Streptomyces swartbergensis]|uniref:aminotransferase class I/II-fold pyridoxal phosphate-dependent enzyme n=1 Tax=Streptomyces swartbergensis TaxID=487165 RepID=UPI00381C5401